MSDERHPAAAEVDTLQTRFPVSYGIFSMARTHRALAAAGLADLGLFPNQEILLLQLGAGDGLSQKTLAATLRVSHVTMAKMVGRLEKAGLVSRQVSAVDRRISLVHLTDAGRAVQGRIIDAWAELEKVTTANLDPATRAGFLAGVELIRPALDAAAGPEDVQE
jgi:DNA-binding MarR family transcriptional regulator